MNPKENQIQIQCSSCGTIYITTPDNYQQWAGGWLCPDCQAERNRQYQYKNKQEKKR